MFEHYQTARCFETRNGTSDVVTQIMSADGYSSMECDFSCSEYRKKQSCTHKNASVLEIKNRMVIESISRNKSVTLQGIDNRQDL